MEKGMATHSSILAWRIPGQRSLVGYSPWGRKESDMTEWQACVQVRACMHTHTCAHTHTLGDSIRFHRLRTPSPSFQTPNTNQIITCTSDQLAAHWSSHDPLLRFDNLAGWLTELKETFPHIYWCIIRHSSSGAARQKRCIHWARHEWQGSTVLCTSPRPTPSQCFCALTNQEAHQILLFKRFYRASSPALCPQLPKQPLITCSFLVMIPKFSLCAPVPYQISKTEFWVK